MKIEITDFGAPKVVARYVEVRDVGAPGAGDIAVEMLTFPISLPIGCSAAADIVAPEGRCSFAGWARPRRARAGGGWRRADPARHRCDRGRGRHIGDCLADGVVVSYGALSGNDPMLSRAVLMRGVGVTGFGLSYGLARRTRAQVRELYADEYTEGRALAIDASAVDLVQELKGRPGDRQSSGGTPADLVEDDKGGGF
jgi:hypothetical protein